MQKALHSYFPGLNRTGFRMALAVIALAVGFSTACGPAFDAPALVTSFEVVATPATAEFETKLVRLEGGGETLTATRAVNGRVVFTGVKDSLLPGTYLVFVKGAGFGVIYLRMIPSTFDIVHAELKKVLSTYSADELAEAFVVVEAKGHRFRKPKD